MHMLVPQFNEPWTNHPTFIGTTNALHRSTPTDRPERTRQLHRWLPFIISFIKL